MGLVTLVVAVPAAGLAMSLGLVPASVQQVLIGPPGQAVACADAASGGERWRVPLDPVEPYTTPEVRGDRVVVTGGRRVRVLSVRDGRELWSVDTESTTPVVSTDLVLVTRARDVAALEASTGRVRWTTTQIRDVRSGLADGGVGADAVVLGLSGDAGIPTIDPSGSPSPPARQLVALDPADGRVRWRVPTGEVSLAGVGDHAYVGYRDGRLEARDLRSGAVAWVASPGTDVRTLVTPGRVHAFTDAYGESGSLVTYDAATGRQLWRRESAQTGGFRAAAAGGVVAVGVASRSDGLIGLDAATGRERWRDPQGGGGSTAATAGLVVVADGDGLRARSAAATAPVWRTEIEAPSRVHLPMVAADGDTVCVLASWNQPPSSD